MSFAGNIKKKLAERRIRSEAALLRREKTAFNIAEAKTIGIVYLFTGSEEFELLKKYVSYLRELKKKVKVVVYYHGKQEPYVQYSKIDYDFFGVKSHNWYGKPSDHILKNFMEEPFDILIDINFTGEPVLTFLSALSMAKFKIGLYEDDNYIHDMQIESSAGKGLKFFLRQVDTYLMKINTPMNDGATGAA
ncbi:MAG TPA: hypothetical protein VFU15_02925 [Bacteroidia bacterium]|nr:hypothetical protein [Bacteroidia bacterium]